MKTVNTISRAVGTAATPVWASIISRGGGDLDGSLCAIDVGGGHAARPSNRRAAGTSTRETWRGEGVYSAREVVQVYHTSTTAIVHAKYMWFSFMVVIITLLLPRAAQRCPPRHYTTFCNGCDPDHSALGRCHVVFAELMATAMPCTCLVLRDASLLPASTP